MLSALESTIKQYARQLGVDQDELPTFGYSRDFGYPHIEVDDKGYHWVVIERDQEVTRLSSQAEDDVLYWTFRSITHSLASSFELKNRKYYGPDSRRIMFSRQVYLMGTLSPSWQVRLEAEHQDILLKYPFRDR